MSEKELKNKLAELEFVNDQLTSELSYVDYLLREIGFPQGLESAKLVAQELINDGEDFNP